jgi:hypothetical protein
MASDLYPHSRCGECGQGLTQCGDCTNKDCGSRCHPSCGPIVQLEPDGYHAHENEDGICWHSVTVERARRENHLSYLRQP